MGEGREEKASKLVLTRGKALGQEKTGCVADGHLLAADFYGMISES